MFRAGIDALLPGGQLRDFVLKGASWTLVGFGAQSIMRLGSSLILTRILVPEAFGLMALATVLVAGMALLSDLGVHASVVRSNEGDDPVYLQTAWTIQVLRGLAIAIVVTVAAYPVSLLYDEPQLAALMPVLSLTAVLGGFVSISLAIETRHHRLGRVTILELGSQFLGILATVLASWWFQSVWGLAVGAVIGAGLKAGLSYLMLPAFNHRWNLDRDATREIIRFGRWILLGTFLGFVAGRGSQAVQGILVPLDILGLLVIAANLAWLPGDVIQRVLNAAVFPAFTRVVRERPGDLSRVITRTQIVLVTLLLPIFVLIAVLSQWIVDLLYDPRYSEAGAFMTIMALNGAVSVLPLVQMSAILALGDSRTHAGLSFVFSVARVGAIFAGFYVGGVYGILLAAGLSRVFLTLVTNAVSYQRGISTVFVDTCALGALGLAYLAIVPGIIP